jgi:hypothetical protein
MQCRYAKENRTISNFTQNEKSLRENGYLLCPLEAYVWLNCNYMIMIITISALTRILIIVAADFLDPKPRSFNYGVYLHVLNLSQTFFIFFCRRSKWVEIDGTVYKVGSCVQLGNRDELPEFAEIQKILVQRDLNMIRFLTSKFTTLCWNEHFQAYEVEKCYYGEDGISLVKQSTLSYFLPLHVVKPFGHHRGTNYIAPRYEIGE